MREIKALELTDSAFKPYGSFARLTNPNTVAFGEEPIYFFRDMLQLRLGSLKAASFSICQTLQRELVIDTAEFHSECCEGILPLDGDVLIHVGVATQGECPYDRFEVFRIPMGTMVSLNPGVWHHAPFSADGTVNTLIVLPERTYANDCIVVNLAPDLQSCITG